MPSVFPYHAFRNPHSEMLLDDKPVLNLSVDIDRLSRHSSFPDRDPDIMEVSTIHLEGVDRRSSATGDEIVNPTLFSSVITVIVSSKDRFYFSSEKKVVEIITI